MLNLASCLKYYVKLCNITFNINERICKTKRPCQLHQKVLFSQVCFEENKSNIPKQSLCHYDAFNPWTVVYRSFLYACLLIYWYSRYFLFSCGNGFHPTSYCSMTAIVNNDYATETFVQNAKQLMVTFVCFHDDNSRRFKKKNYQSFQNI